MPKPRPLRRARLQTINALMRIPTLSCQEKGAKLSTGGWRHSAVSISVSWLRNWLPAACILHGERVPVSLPYFIFCRIYLTPANVSSPLGIISSRGNMNLLNPPPASQLKDESVIHTNNIGNEIEKTTIKFARYSTRRAIVEASIVDRVDGLGGSFCG